MECQRKRESFSSQHFLNESRTVAHIMAPTFTLPQCPCLSEGLRMSIGVILLIWAPEDRLR